MAFNLGGFASGLTSGIDAGQQIKARAIQIKQAQMALDQEKAKLGAAAGQWQALSGYGGQDGGSGGSGGGGGAPAMPPPGQMIPPQGQGGPPSGAALPGGSAMPSGVSAAPAGPQGPGGVSFAGGPPQPQGPGGPPQGQPPMAGPPQGQPPMAGPPQQARPPMGQNPAPPPAQAGPPIPQRPQGQPPQGQQGQQGQDATGGSPGLYAQDGSINPQALFQQSSAIVRNIAGYINKAMPNGTPQQKLDALEGYLNTVKGVEQPVLEAARLLGQTQMGMARLAQGDKRLAQGDERLQGLEADRAFNRSYKTATLTERKKMDDYNESLKGEQLASQEGYRKWQEDHGDQMVGLGQQRVDAAAKKTSYFGNVQLANTLNKNPIGKAYLGAMTFKTRVDALAADPQVAHNPSMQLEMVDNLVQAASGGVARKAQFDKVARSAGFADLAQMHSYLLDGKGILGPKQIANIKRAMDVMADGARAEAIKIFPNEVARLEGGETGDQGGGGGQQGTGGGGNKGPAPGSVEGGYKFKGGDPTKQENWVKVGR